MFFSFKIYLKRLKKLWVHQLVIYKTFLNSKCKKEMRKKFNLKIKNYDILFEMFWKKNFKPF
jgi:hypothetical protein